MSFEKAVEAGSEGLVTDVINSYDGVPFLMHDRTLRRTTNIDKVFLKTGPTPCGHVYLGGAAEPEHRLLVSFFTSEQVKNISSSLCQRVNWVSTVVPSSSIRSVRPALWEQTSVSGQDTSRSAAYRPSSSWRLTRTSW
ncbi:unnamed protein product [Pleuronectes platessa]|uniref:GP-PDE domain-containing protein n=1 Tax=Pleuronectes platessa TaxID=8262 RepID=A0A9N7TTD9_PLEPL|nr:unnamed protein product [Pleuronectes platessa]